ncbi:MAG: 1-acyl-sn-glycerol-3-phosphate acyltransferase, partial [Gammaproteobacteria bacterium]
RSGRNLYPDEIEDAVGAVPGVRRGCVVACGVGDPERGSERLVILAETRETDAQRLARLHDAIVAAVAARIGEPPDDVVLAPPKAVLKTSSGKLRRAATRERYLAGTLGRTPRAARWQIVRLALGAAPALLAQRLRRVPVLLYGAYAWLLFALFAPVAWLLVVSAPRPQAAWRMLHVLSRGLLRSARVGLTVDGLGHIPRDKACVIVVNHASYLDGLMLLAALPCHARFVAKREFLDTPIARLFLRRLGCEFVERFAVHRSVEDARRLDAAVRAGASLIMFPEGTFSAAPALLPFHLGAFVVAARSGVPVIPVAIRGTRAMLRADSWLPRRGAAAVTISAPIEPPAAGGETFATAVALRDRARASILALCGEPDSQPAQPAPGVAG